MGVDQTSLDRIRSATFPSARRGYDKQEVEKFLSRLADWLETGAEEDDSRSETVKRELKRVGERTGAILAQAEESAEEIRTEARAEVASAHSDAAATRAKAEEEASETRAKATADAATSIEDAEARAERIAEEGIKRRREAESVIADLVRRRDEVVAEIDALKAKLSAAADEHRPRGDDDRFAAPDELDPAARKRDEDEASQETQEYSALDGKDSGGDSAPASEDSGEDSTPAGADPGRETADQPGARPADAKPTARRE